MVVLSGNRKAGQEWRPPLVWRLRLPRPSAAWAPGRSLLLWPLLSDLNMGDRKALSACSVGVCSCGRRGLCCLQGAARFPPASSPGAVSWGGDAAGNSTDLAGSFRVRRGHAPPYSGSGGPRLSSCDPAPLPTPPIPASAPEPWAETSHPPGWRSELSRAPLVGRLVPPTGLVTGKEGLSSLDPGPSGSPWRWPTCPSVSVCPCACPCPLRAHHAPSSFSSLLPSRTFTSLRLRGTAPCTTPSC